MEAAPKPANETQRLEALRSYRILDSGYEPAYDDITYLAIYICGMPMAAITLIDETRQWFKAKVGLDGSETQRDPAFCAHTILQNDALIVADAEQDSRFVDNPFVVGAPHIRFYAGMPLINPDGYALGSLCVIDTKPNGISDEQSKALAALSRQTMLLMETRRVSDNLAAALDNVKVLHGMLPICCYCKRVRDDQGYWNKIEEYISARSDATFTHGACKECADKALQEVRAQLKASKTALGLKG